MVHRKIAAGSSRVRAVLVRSLSDGEETTLETEGNCSHDPRDYYHFIMRTITDSTHQRVRNCVPIGLQFHFHQLQEL
ncbi:hypothetical protein EJ110_NYTH26875 [Nymphaea thermarum]|nr:hypothetical protein EJ110_NYTH26875 [Nymphaea thermarum]